MHTSCMAFVTYAFSLHQNSHVTTSNPPQTPKYPAHTTPPILHLVGQQIEQLRFRDLGIARDGGGGESDGDGVRGDGGGRGGGGGDVGGGGW